MLKKLFTFLLIFTLVGTITSCGSGEPEDPDAPFVILKGFVDSGKSVYTIDESTEGSLNVKYNKGENADAFFTKEIKISDKLEKYKKLVVSMKGTGSAKIVLVGTSEEKFIGLKAPAGSTTFQWNLDNDVDFLKTVKKVSIYCAPGKTKSVGDITFSKLQFETSTAFGKRYESGDTDIKEGTNDYDGASETFSFNANWKNYNNGTDYEIVENNDDSVTFNYPTKKEDWSCLATFVDGKLSVFDYVTFKIKGQIGHTLIVKVNDDNTLERKIAFTSTDEKIISVSLKDKSAGAKDAIDKIILIPDQGTKNTGSFTINKAYFSKVNEDPSVNVYNGNDTTFNINKNIQDGGDKNYTVSFNNNITSVNYAKTTSTYAYMEVAVDGKLSNFDFLTFKVKGTAEQKIMLKIEVKITDEQKEVAEEIYVLNGNDQTFTLDISHITVASRDKIKKVLIFAGPNQTNVSGAFTINGLYFTNTFEQTSIDYNRYISGDTFDANNFWIDNGDKTYTITKNGTSYNVTYAKTVEQPYAAMTTKVAGKFESFTKIEFVISGSVGQNFMMKAEGTGVQKESAVTTLNGDNTTITIDISSIPAEQRNLIRKLLVFAEPNKVDANSNNSFTIVSVTFKK